MDSDQAKLFVGGISRETNFGKYGTVLGYVIAKDKVTQIPRGFGFVWFSDPSPATKALRDSHVILGRTVSFFPILFLVSYFVMLIGRLQGK